MIDEYLPKDKVIILSFISILILIGCSFTPVEKPTIISSGILASNVRAREMAIDQDYIFWITESGFKNKDDKWVQTNKIEEIRKTSGKIDTIIEEPLIYYYLTVDTKFIYWVSEDRKYSSNVTESLEQIEIRGGKPTILLKGKKTIKYLIQDSDSLFFVSESQDGSNTLQLIQMQKSDGRTLIIESNNGDIDDVFVHQNFIYWKTCDWDPKKCELKRKSLMENGNVTVIANEDYGYPYSTDTGIYWLGNNFIYFDDSTEKISVIFSYGLFNEPTNVVGKGGIETEVGISNIIYVNGSNFYFSESFSAVPGFSSCTDESEGIIKITGENHVKNTIGLIRGSGKYYRVNHSVFIYGYCNDIKVLNLQNDVLSEGNFGGISLIIADEKQIYWIDNYNNLITKALGNEY